MTDIQKTSSHLSGTEQTLAHFQKQSGPNYQPRPDLDASIEAKVRLAHAAKRHANLSETEISELVQSIEFTPEEKRYAAEQNIYRMTKVVFGQRIIDALDEHFKMPHEDIVPCLTAYFEAKANGELEAA